MTEKEILKATPEEVRHFAHKQLDRFGWRYTGIGLFPDLLHNISIEDFDSVDDYADLNLNLSPKSCFGRLALAGAFAEKYYSISDLYACDVIEDWFRVMVSKDMQTHILKEPSLINEVLMYEDPHLILMVGDAQFEPLSKVIGGYISHPKIEKYPLWELVLSGMLCAVVRTSNEISTKRLALQKAKLFGETIELLYMQIFLSTLEEDFEQVVSLSEQLLKRKKSARAKHAIYALTGKYRDELIKEYTPEIFNFFRNNYNL